MSVELLAPAKNLEYGIAAINHGADAVYIGAPAFGARQAATNSIADIEQLVKYAHIFRCKVYATVNTLLFDDEVEPAVGMIHQLYHAGVDALIIQDLGLLECDLPPIELHASTQCHNYDLERVRFLASQGFSRIILARECSLEQIRQIRENTSVELEAFVHGALCVSFSGQCYMSQYLNQRSGNRGQCSQPCRSAYDLCDASGRALLRNKHLLSLKDFSAADHLKQLITSGITSLKIEGRLKDLPYVKNITAHYRKLLDDMDIEKSSDGHVAVAFTPDPERTFNRGYTDYFLHGRQPMASLDTQKSLGKYIGKVDKVDARSLVINTKLALAAGDGFCFFDNQGLLQGFIANRVEGNRLYPNSMPAVAKGTKLWRNHDHLFEKLLSLPSATRKIPISLNFYITPNGFGISINGTVHATIEAPHDEAQDSEKCRAMIVKQLSKLGDTPFEVDTVAESTEGRFFVHSSILNELRRNAVKQYVAYRQQAFAPNAHQRKASPLPYPVANGDYRLNVVNKKAEEYYKHHGVREVEHGLEQTHNYAGHALMTTKYCLRYELGCCLKGKSTHQPTLNIAPRESLFLHNNGRRYALRFDCKHCQMIVSAMQDK